MTNKILIIISLICLSGNVYSKCNFKHFKYLSELTNPESIQMLKIEIPKSKKYFENFLKILLSKQSVIKPEQKKKFNGKLKIIYNFGNCEFDIRLRQNGDFKDHIAIVDGKAIRSLDIKIKNGNILNAVHFKLLIPKTRENLNEIFGTVVFRELGFIAPESFMVNTIINGVKTKMIFQENARKEMLERNSRREGPIFEGDESISWGENFFDFSKDQISLSRLVNKNWFLKGPQSATITLNAFTRLQKAYHTRIDNSIKLGFHIQPNIHNLKMFDDFHFFSLALGGKHGLSPNNRKFYFNTFLDDFEPIYYDGNFKLEKLEDGFFGNIVNASSPNRYYSSKFNIPKFTFSSDYKVPKLEFIKSNKFKNLVSQKFKKRSLMTSAESDMFVENGLKIFNSNIKKMLIKLDDKQIEKYEDYIPKNNDDYLSRVKNSKIEQKLVTDIDLIEGNFKLNFNDGTVALKDFNKLGSMLSRLTLDRKRVVYLSPQKSKYLLSDFKTDYNNDLNGYIFKSKDIKYKFIKESKMLLIESYDLDGWLLLKDINLSNWTILFNGKSILKNKKNSQRFNNFGLTGCLNFYNVIFHDTVLKASNTSCEDGINIVNSIGKIKILDVKDSLSDGVDIDFSNLDIESLSISNSGNDCFDVSGGNYVIKKSFVSNCGDKGLSVGEMSKLYTSKLRVNSALIAVSSKDLSSTKINLANLMNVNYCYEAIQKKMEFGGALLEFNHMSCNGSKKKLAKIHLLNLIVYF